MKRKHALCYGLAGITLVLAGLQMFGIVGSTMAEDDSKVSDKEKPKTITDAPAQSTNDVASLTTSKRLGPSGRDTLLKNAFQEKEAGVFEKKHMTLRDAKALFHFDTTDMRPVPSCPPTEQSYWVNLQDALCVVTIKGGDAALKFETNLVDMVVNTNAIPTSRKLTPRVSPIVKEKPSATNEKK